MKSKAFTALLFAIAIALVWSAYPCHAEGQMVDTVVEAQSFLDGILAFQGVSGETTIQDWIDGSLTQNAGIGAEWYVFALSQYGDYDFTRYEKALLTYLEEHTVRSAVSRLKYLLCLAAIGSNSTYLNEVPDTSVGEMGLMSWVFGLHLGSNGMSGERYGIPEMQKVLLSLQCEDGGWAISGKYGDVDATAMTVQALAPYYESDAAVREAVEKALLFLSERQLEDGDYASYGVPNPESTAQVLVALSALGIDCAEDPRFCKNGCTLIDGIAKYAKEDGSFCHKEGGEGNATATEQVFYAMVAYRRLQDGKPSLYWLDAVHADSSDGENRKDVESVQSGQETVVSEPKDEVTSSHPSEETALSGVTPSSGKSYKGWACLGIVFCGGLVCLILVLVKKRHIKNFLAVGLVVCLALTAVCLTDIRSAADYYNRQDAVKDDVIGSVTMTIRCDTVAGREEHIPQDGTILPLSTFAIAEGDTVYTILVEAARKYQIQFENDGNGTYVYIAGIGYLYEFDYGDLSGWIYLVNGEQPSVGAGEYRLKDRDVIEWHYTCNLGEDLK